MPNKGDRQSESTKADMLTTYGPGYLCNCGKIFPTPYERTIHWAGCEVMQREKKEMKAKIETSMTETDAECPECKGQGYVRNYGPTVFEWERCSCNPAPTSNTETRRRPHKNYPKVLVAWMRDKIPGEGDFTTFINENDQAGGFKYSIIDYEPDDPENWVKLYITTEDPAPIANTATRDDAAKDYADFLKRNYVTTSPCSMFKAGWDARDEEVRRLTGEVRHLKYDNERIKLFNDEILKERDRLRDALEFYRDFHLWRHVDGNLEVSAGGHRIGERPTYEPVHQRAEQALKVT